MTAKPTVRIDPASGDSGLQPRQDSALAHRRRHRKRNLETLDGAAREHARVVRGLSDGTLSLAAGEVLSRALARHCSILREIEELNELRQLAASVKALESQGTTPALGWQPASITTTTVETTDKPVQS